MLKTSFLFIQKHIPEDPCVPNQCQNSGKCVSIPNGYRCICPEGYLGTNCATSTYLIFIF
jgi:hypothetical protein